jgi:hypothetical protein
VAAKVPGWHFEGYIWPLFDTKWPGGVGNGIFTPRGQYHLGGQLSVPPASVEFELQNVPSVQLLAQLVQVSLMMAVCAPGMQYTPAGQIVGPDLTPCCVLIVIMPAGQ